MGYGRGFDAVQAAIEKANEAGDFTPFILTHPIQSLWNMTWEDGETKVVRFLTDDVVTIGFHNFIATRDGKRAEFVDTSQLEGELKRPDFIAANFKNEKGKPLRPTTQTIGIVVERVLNPETKEYEDVTRTYQTPSDPEDPNSEKVDVEWPAFWIIKQGMRFWGQVNSYWSDLGTTTNRNFKIKRTGKTAQNTTYTVMPDMKEDGATTESLVELYGIPAVEGYEDDVVQGHIVQWIERRGTPKWFEKITGPVEKEDAPKSTARPTLGAKPKVQTTKAAPSEEPAEDSAPVDDSPIKDRIKKYSLSGKK